MQSSPEKTISHGTKPLRSDSPSLLDRIPADGTQSEATLLRLSQIALEFGADNIAMDARSLAERISEGRFYVACLGQFKRGKSTLLNALVGQAVLPTGVVPVTTVPTILRYGDTTSARVRFHAGDWNNIEISDVEGYVSEDKNPENAKGVAALEIFVPSQLLSSGMCFVDTPGIGSVFSGNTSATQAFIPHIDAALLVTGTDPPLSGEELALVETVTREVEALIVVLNKADKTTDAEKSVAVAFAKRQLERKLHREIGEVFEVSATDHASGGPERNWHKFVETLEKLVRQSGRNLVQSASIRGLERVTDRLLAIIAEERRALVQPVEESERRIITLKRTIGEAEKSLRELSYLFMAEQQHLSDTFIDHHKSFLANVLPQADHQFASAVASLPWAFGPSYRRKVMQKAQEIASAFVMPWLAHEQDEAERQYQQVASRFIEMGNAFLAKLADAGIPELARVPNALDTEMGFRVRSRFMFIDFIEVAQPASPLRWLADIFLVLIGLRKQIQNAGHEFLEKLLVVNSTRVQSDILNRVQESRGYLEVEIRKLLHEISRIAEQALQRARQVKEKGAAAIDSALYRLDGLEQEIQKLRQLPAHA
jgi:GTP-binding protein EngB required for normal cell division